MNLRRSLAVHRRKPNCETVGLFARRRTGAVTVETSLILMLWVLMLVGTFDLGMAVFRHNMLAHVSRQGVRQAIVHGKLAAPLMSSWGPSKYVGKASATDEIASSMRQYLKGFSLTDVTITVEWPDGGNEVQERVKVSVSSTYRPVLAVLIGNRTVPLSASSTMPIAH